MNILLWSNLSWGSLIEFSDSRGAASHRFQREGDRLPRNCWLLGCHVNGTGKTQAAKPIYTCIGNVSGKERKNHFTYPLTSQPRLLVDAFLLYFGAHRIIFSCNPALDASSVDFT